MKEETPILQETVARVETRVWVKKRLKRWIGIGVAAFAITAAFCVFMIPQSYKSSISLSVASSTGSAGAGAGGLLQAITGAGGSANSKYVGVLKSRRFAEQVVRQLGLQRIYHQPNFDEAVEALQKNVNVDDDPKDGLLHVDVTIGGPPRLAFNSDKQRETVRVMSAKAANLYAELLQQYVLSDDVDSDTLLLKKANKKLKETRDEYDLWVAKVADFVRSHGDHLNSNGGAELAAKGGGMSGDDIGPSGKTGGDSVADELGAIYTDRAKVQAEMEATAAAQRLGEQRREVQLRYLPVLPSEDPLLEQARSNVTLLRTILDNDSVLLGPEHPTVVTDREKLRLAQVKLDQQSRSIKRGLTTAQAEADMKMKELTTRYATLGKQIKDLETEAQIARNTAVQFQALRAEVAFRTELLKTVWTDTATLSLQVVAAEQRVKVLDSGIPPRYGAPRILTFLMLCALVSGGLLAVLIRQEYRDFLATQPNGHSVSTVD